MLHPFSDSITDIAVIFAHTVQNAADGNRVYGIGATRIPFTGKQTHFSSLVKGPSLRAREFMLSRITGKQLAKAPSVNVVSIQLREFLEGVSCLFVLDPGDAFSEISELCGNSRIVDIGFLSDFFLPWIPSASPRQLWEGIHGNSRDKVSFSLEEGAQLGVDFLQFLFGTMLTDTVFPAARALRHYLRSSNTLLGDACCHLLSHFTEYFGGLLSPVSADPAPDWRRFLEEAPAVKKGHGAGAFVPLPHEDMRPLYDELAHQRKGYSVRDPQVTYASHVAKALNTGSVACIEAGTGTGKTLGYLLPVMEFLTRNPGERVALATYTKSLQTQLYGHELTACKELLGRYKDIPVALVKGKSNYVCARKLDDVYASDMEGVPLLTWLFFVNICYRYRLADCDDISPRLRKWLDENRQLTGVLLEVSAGSGCHATHSECPAQVVTAEAANARLVITNHNKLILMDDDSKLNGLFRHVVIDEANHFEEAMRSAKSHEVISSDLFGYCQYLREQCRKIMDSPAVSGFDKQRAGRVVADVGELLIHMDELRERFLIMDGGSRNGAVSFAPEHAVFTEGNVTFDIARLKFLLEEIYEHSALVSGKESRRLPLPYKILSRARTMRMLVYETLHSLHMMQGKMDYEGSWKSVQVFAKSWGLSCGDVYVGKLVREYILARRDTVIFTSATLTHQASFAPFRRSLGLGKGQNIVFENEEVPPKKCFVTRVAPPFTPDFSLVVPSGTPSAMYDNKSLWLDHTVEELPRLIEANKGATLVLCASYEDLEYLREALELTYDGEYPLLFQKKGEPPAALCDEFRAAKESVLFGVETFWHGVDFPGDTLTQVIITRLPYPSPSSPLMSARQEFLPEGGYWERYRYETAIKVRQGIGRLVRRETDTGLVVVLDSRLIKSPKLASPYSVIEGMHNVPKKHRLTFRAAASHSAE